MESKGICLFINTFTRESVGNLINYLMLNQYAEEPVERVNLYICSQGGETNLGFAIIDVMRALSYPVYTYGLGEVYSTGLMILMAGEKGHRYMFKNTSLLSHQWWAEPSEGKAHEFHAYMKESKRVDARILEFYKECTGLSTNKIKRNLLGPSDTYLSSDDAIKYHIVDHVIDKFEIIPSRINTKSILLRENDEDIQENY